MHINPTFIICSKVTFLFIRTMALGGVPIGKRRAKEIDSTIGARTAIGDKPCAGPDSYDNKIIKLDIKTR